MIWKYGIISQSGIRVYYSLSTSMTYSHEFMHKPLRLNNVTNLAIL